jgi:DNA polymerase-1
MNIPIRTALGKRVRQGYVCPQGYSFLSVDYSKIEPRILAHLSADPIMCQIFHDGRDIYKEVAARMWNIPVDAVTSEQYTVAKEVTLGSMYGMGPDTLQEQLWAQGLLHYTIKDCERFLHGFWQVFTVAKRYKKQVAAAARRVGYVRDHWGMYRYLPAINSWDNAARAEAERHAVSHKVQPFAQGMLQNATAYLWQQLCKLRDAGYDVCMWIQMHDEIGLLHRDADGLSDVLEGLTIDAMVNHAQVELDVPVVAEAAHGKTWGQLKT